MDAAGGAAAGGGAAPAAGGVEGGKGPRCLDYYTRLFYNTTLY